MEVLVTCERRLMRTPDGQVWTTSIDYARFWSRYLSVFSLVRVLGRVREVASAEPKWRPVTGPGIEVEALPIYAGPTQYLRNRREIRNVCRKALERQAAVILRTPGSVALSLFGPLADDGRPYGVEVTGDPYDVFAPGAIRHPLRPLLRRVFVRSLERQCRNAAAASYVTEHALQTRYPPGTGAFSTHYSSVSLPHEAFAAAPKSPRSEGPMTVVSVGSMEVPYKGLDILIAAVIACRARGRRLQLLIIGGGAELDNLRRQAAPLGEDVRFTGELPGADRVRETMAGADLFVLPSLTEGLPRAMIEAMALGLPCIGTQVGGIPELLPAEDLVRAGDVDGLSSKLMEICADPARLRRGAERNLQQASEYRDEVLTGRRTRMYAFVRDATEAHFGAKERPRG